MNKSILVKFVIFLVVAALVYSVFWFFKAGQLHKQLEAFVSKNSNYVSAGEIEVTGFPLAQKVTVRDLKFTLPGSLLNKRQTIVKQLEATAGVLSSDFVITMPEPVTVQDSDNNNTAVEFNQAPEISFSINDGMISKFNYQDSGYKLTGLDKNIIYSASSSAISSISSLESDGSTKTKISVNIKDVEGFDAVDLYKNLFEKKIADGLKTGEITLGSSVPDANIPTDVVATEGSAEAAPATHVETPNHAANTTTAPTINDSAPITGATEVAASTAHPEELKPPVEEIVSTPLKSNFMAELEYISITSKDETVQIPTDPTQVQEIPTQSSKVVKITSLEFSNQLYKISVSGEANLLADDALPSGSLAVKIEKIDALVNSLVSYFSKITERAAPIATPETEVQSVDLIGNAALTEDAYRNFLGKFSIKLGAVAKEVAAKNPVSTDDSSEFDIRREKNLEFLINETSVREVFGKF
jgi:hypothetical protein